MCAIQVFRSSLELVWILYISGSLEEAQMRNMAFSSWATSLTISFWREMTDGLLSWDDNKKKRRRKTKKKKKSIYFHSSFTSNDPLKRVYLPQMQKRISDLSLAAEAKRRTKAPREYLAEHSTGFTSLRVDEADRKRLRCGQTFESARSSLPADRAVVQQAPPALRQVLPPKHTPVFELSQRLWLHLVVYVSESGVLLVHVDLRVHLDDGLFDQTQSSGQVLVLLCPSCGWEEPRMSSGIPQYGCMISSGGGGKAGPSVLLRMRSTRTGYLVMRCVTSRMHSVTPNLRTMGRLLIFCGAEAGLLVFNMQAGWGWGWGWGRFSL